MEGEKKKPEGVSTVRIQVAHPTPTSALPMDWREVGGCKVA